MSKINTILVDRIEAICGTISNIEQLDSIALYKIYKGLATGEYANQRTKQLFQQDAEHLFYSIVSNI